MRREIVVLGGRGDGLVVAQAIRDLADATGTVVLAGFLDDAVTAGTQIGGVPVLGTLEQWRTCPEEVFFVAALHKLKQMPARKRRIVDLGIPDARCATVSHPTAVVASGAMVGAGSYVGPHAVLQPGTTVGRHASIRAGANLGHDCAIEDFAYVGPNATLCGRSRLMEGAHLGPNSVVVDGQTVEPFAVIGAGTVVTKRVPAFEVHFGVPARRVGTCARPGAGRTDA